jgi:hypothetical protein
MDRNSVFAKNDLKDLQGGFPVVDHFPLVRTQAKKRLNHFHLMELLVFLHQIGRYSNYEEQRR